MLITDPSIDLAPAIKALATGGVIAYPTEAVFGLGCNPSDEAALRRIIEIKGRDAHKGFILIASTQSQLSDFIAPLSDAHQTLLKKHWPGPVTFVVPANEKYRKSLLSGYRDTLAVRVSGHATVVELCNQYDGAIVSTSANISGTAALQSAASVRSAMGSELDAIVDAAVGDLGSPTTIIDLQSGERLR